MSYKKEIDFILNGQIEIKNASKGSWVERDGDYDYADRRYNGTIETSECRVNTNFGYLNFRTVSCILEYEEHEGESNKWEQAEHLDSSSARINFNGKGIDFSLEKEEVNNIDEFISSIKKLDSNAFHDEEGYYKYLSQEDMREEMERQKLEEQDIYDLYDTEEEYLVAMDAKNNPVHQNLAIHDMPAILLNDLVEKNPEAFEGLSVTKLQELTKAMSNTSTPKTFLDKVATLSESAQVSTVYFATKKSKAEVDRLLSREKSPKAEDEYSSMGY